MPVHNEQLFSPYNTQALFDMVADIERYPDFLPWCRAARILSRSEGECMAELVISFKHLTESYVSRVVLNRPASGDAAGNIDVTMVEGPFAHLVNRWTFTPHNGGTQIGFFLDFSFRSRLLEMLIGGLFTKATHKMAQAFKERADRLYGRS